MDRDLQTYFSKTRALIFFSEIKSEDWSVNSSTAALNSLRDNIWADDYYFRPVVQSFNEHKTNGFEVMPNPASSYVQINFEGDDQVTAELMDLTGRNVLRAFLRNGDQMDLSALPRGVYLVVLNGSRQAKLVLH